MTKAYDFSAYTKRTKNLYSYFRQQGRINFGSYETSRRRGTIRYMAPEVITQSFHPDSFEPYKAADAYGFALVMWEIANRTRVKGARLYFLH